MFHLIKQIKTDDTKLTDTKSTKLDAERSKREDQYCRFCLDKNSILTKETCCTGCGALNSMET